MADVIEQLTEKELENLRKLAECEQTTEKDRWYIRLQLPRLLAEMEELRAITTQSIQVRAAQKMYFRERTQSHLAASKDAEKVLDQLIARYSAPRHVAAQKPLL